MSTFKVRAWVLQLKGQYVGTFRLRKGYDKDLGYKGPCRYAVYALAFKGFLESANATQVLRGVGVRKKDVDLFKPWFHQIINSSSRPERVCREDPVL